MTEVILPELEWLKSPNFDARQGHPVNIIVVHRWGAHSTPVPASTTKENYEGVQSWFENPASKVSAHIVMPGSAVPGKATQMVEWGNFAWAEAAYNPNADEVECADDIFLGNDPTGLAVTARIVACRLHARGLPPVWSTTKGFCRHADLGVSGGDHPDCPTVDMTFWKSFIKMVQSEYARSGCRDPWGQ